MTALTDTERSVLLTPCECGHTINDHGGLVACWRCEDEGDECATEFETLLVERVARIVDGRVGEKGSRKPTEPICGPNGLETTNHARPTEGMSA